MFDDVRYTSDIKAWKNWAHKLTFDNNWFHQKYWNFSWNLSHWSVAHKISFNYEVIKISESVPRLKLLVLESVCWLGSWRGSRAFGLRRLRRRTICSMSRGFRWRLQRSTWPQRPGSWTRRARTGARRRSEIKSLRFEFWFSNLELTTATASEPKTSGTERVV